MDIERGVRIIKTNPVVRRLGTFRRPKYFSRLVVTMILLAVLPIFIVSIIAYYQVTKTFEQETSEANLQYLGQTISGMEIIIDQIKQSSRQVLLNKSFGNFEGFPNGAYYEAISGVIKPEDLETNYWYRRNKDAAIQNFQSLILINSFVDTAYFYDFYKGFVITVDKEGNMRQYRYDQFYDKGWSQLIQESGPNSMVVLPREATLENGSIKKALTIVIRSEMPNNAFIINLDEDKVYNRVIRKLNQADDLYVISDTGSVVLQPRGKKNSPELLQQYINRSAQYRVARGYELAKLDGENLLIAHSISALLGWTFISVADLNQISSSSTYLKQIIFLSALLLIVSAVLMSYASSRSLYKPVRQIASVLRSKAMTHQPDTEPSLDEWKYIGNAVNATLLEKDFLQKKLDESLPHYRERFKHALVTSTSSYTIEDFEDKRRFLEIDIDPERFALLLVSLDDYKANIKGLETRSHELYKLEVIGRIESSNLISGGKYLTVEIDEDLIAVVLNMVDEHLEEAFVIAQNLLEQLNTTLQGTFSIGVGRYCRTVKELPRAYEEALEALHYRMVYGSGQVIYIDDIVIEHDRRYKYPKDKEEMLTGLIRIGDGSGAKHAFQLIVDSMERHKKNLRNTYIQAMYTQLLTGILHTLQQTGVDEQRLFTESPYEELYRKQSIKEITGWFDGLIDRATERIGIELQSKGNHHVTKVIDMLQSDLGADWSLNIVSTRLQLNPAYVGRLFKQYTGRAFIEYLTGLRIERSKRLLADPQMTVNEVSRQMGYHNAYYFIKLFKESTGLTPGEYRKKQSQV
jgi:two-component system response regulator YesN